MKLDWLLFGKKILVVLLPGLLGVGYVRGQSGVVDKAEEVVIENSVPVVAKPQVNVPPEGKLVEDTIIQDVRIPEENNTFPEEDTEEFMHDDTNTQEEGVIEENDNALEEEITLVDEIIVENNSEGSPSIWTLESIDENTASGSGIKLTPVVVHRNPFRVKFGNRKLPLLSTVRSIDVTGGETSYCSMIARLNKQQFYPNATVIRGLGGPGQISVGNATQLIQNGIRRGLLTRVPATELEEVLNRSSALAVDVYLYKAHKNGVLTMADITNFNPKDPVFDAYLMQGHRFVMFRADDSKWYALDTIRGTRKTIPQPLAEYIKTPYNQTRGYYIHTDIFNGGGSDLANSARFDIYPYASSATRSVQGPWSMVSLFDVASAHQLDLLSSSCNSLVADDSFFWGGMTMGGEGAYWYEEDRHIRKV